MTSYLLCKSCTDQSRRSRKAAARIAERVEAAIRRSLFVGRLEDLENLEGWQGWQ